MTYQELDLSKQYTYADYLTWQFDEMVELIKGKIYKMSPAPNRRHQDIAFNITRSVGNSLAGYPCKVYPAPFDLRLPKLGEKADSEIYTVVQPDLCIVCDLSKLDDRGCLGAPDLIIEILSPSTAQKDVTEKYHLYEQSGVKEYWITDPTNETLLPYTLGDDGRYNASKMLSKSERIQSRFLPVLQLELTDVFAE